MITNFSQVAILARDVINNTGGGWGAGEVEMSLPSFFPFTYGKSYVSLQENGSEVEHTHIYRIRKTERKAKRYIVPHNKE